MVMGICREVIAQLESAQESRQLSPIELQLLRLLKKRVLGLAVIEKSRVRQKSHLTWLRKGDANTMATMAMLNLHNNVNTKIVYDHYLNHIGSYVPRSYKLKLDNLGWQSRNLGHLELPFTEQKIHVVIKTTPKEKAQGPKGSLASSLPFP